MGVLYSTAVQLVTRHHNTVIPGLVPRDPWFSPHVKRFGALARHTSALAADRGAPGTRPGMTG